MPPTPTTTCIQNHTHAGSQRVAMRTGSSTLNFILGDHLGSTSLTTSGTGAYQSETRYKPWGEVRYSSGTLPTKYTFTGQYSYAGNSTTDFGLLYYNARWVDPMLGRFTQADTLIPEPGNPQSWDRFAYVNNNPVKYTDPSGFFSEGQLEQWYGENWMQILIEKYSEQMALLLTKAEFGDMVTYIKNGQTFGAIFARGKSGNLEFWDVSAKSSTSIEKMDRNPIMGLYTRDKGSDSEYTLANALSNKDLNRHYSLSEGWSRGEKEFLGSTVQMSFEEPSFAGWAGIVVTVFGLIPGGKITLTLGILGLGLAGVDMVKIESVDQISDYYWMPHNPTIPGEPNSPQWVGPTVYGTPMPPTPLK